MSWLSFASAAAEDSGEDEAAGEEEPAVQGVGHGNLVAPAGDSSGTPGLAPDALDLEAAADTLGTLGIAPDALVLTVDLGGVDAAVDAAEVAEGAVVREVVEALDALPDDLVAGGVSAARDEVSAARGS